MGVEGASVHVYELNQGSPEKCQEKTDINLDDDGVRSWSIHLMIPWYGTKMKTSSYFSLMVCEITLQ